MTEMQLTPLMEKFVLHWGEMGTRWGVNRTVSQIHALLYLSPDPLAADEIAETLSVARSNVSTSLKELQSWNLVKVSHVMGDRRDRFSAHADTWDMLFTIMQERKRREVEPTLAVLRECVREMDDDRVTPDEVKARIKSIETFFSNLTSWFDQMVELPRSTLTALMRLGAKVANFVPKSLERRMR
jgi:DNA-binding transcriptional regulator GbsR (MarR family)